MRIEGSAEAVLADPLPETTLWASTGSMATYPGPLPSAVDFRGRRSHRSREGPVTALAWAPDGNYLAIAESAGVRVVDARRGVAVDLLRGLTPTSTSWTGPSRNRHPWSQGGLTATWQVAAHEILSVDGSRAMDLAANPDRTVMYALGRGGTVTRSCRRCVDPGGDSECHPVLLDRMDCRRVVGSATDSGGL